MTAWNWLAVGVLSSTALAQTPAPAPASATAEMLARATVHDDPQPQPASAVQQPAAEQQAVAERVSEVEDVPPPKPAASRVTAVTVYTESALVTREVAVPEGKGLIELVVTPLPTETIRGSLYTEGSDGLRVLSTRFRTRAVKEDTRQSVRARRRSVRSLELDAQRVKKEMQVSQQDLDFLQKLENFTSATMQGLADKGKLDVEATIKLSTYVMESRARHATAMVDQEQKLQANAAFDAIRPATAPGAVGRLAADGDRCRDRRRQGRCAGGERPAELPGRRRHLATAVSLPFRRRQGPGPARIPGGDRAAIGRGVARRAGHPLHGPAGRQCHDPRLAPARDHRPRGGRGRGRQGGRAGPEFAVDRRDPRSAAFRGQAQQAMVGNDAKAGGAFLNEAAALDQAEELLAADEDREEREGAAAGPPAVGGGPSVTYRLRSRLTIPSARTSSSSRSAVPR